MSSVENSAALRKRALSNITGCSAVLALVCIPGACLALVAALTERKDPNAIVSIPLTKISSECTSFAVATIFSLIIGFVVAGWLVSKSRRLAPLALLAFAACAALPLWYWYADFVLVSIDNTGGVELRYLWPRPSLRTSVARISDVQATETTQTTDENITEAHFKWRLDLDVDGTRRQSVATNLPSRVLLAQDHLLREHARARLLKLEHAGNSADAAVADALMDFGAASLALELPGNARDAFASATVIRERTDGPESLPVARAAFGLARALLALKDSATAEEQLRRVVAIHAALKLPDDEPEKLDALYAYDALLEASGRPRTMPRTPYTPMTDLIRRHGRVNAQKIMEQLMAQRRIQREQPK